MSATDDFHALAVTVVDDLLRLDPVSATELGDHRFDDFLPDLSPSGVASALRLIDEDVTALDAIDDLDLGIADLVDLEILRAALLRSRFGLDELRAFTWDPMTWNPGSALYVLASRDFAPADQRAVSLRRRLSAIPDLLADARSQLGEMSRIHAETAIAQLSGTRALIDGDVRVLAADDRVVDEAAAQIAAFSDWLRDRLPDALRSPRLGERLYAGTLWHSLDDDTSAADLLADAEGHLGDVCRQMREAAAQYLGVTSTDDDGVRAALGGIAAASPVTDETVLPLMHEAFTRTTAFAQDHGIVTVPELDVRLIDMPEIHRGVAVAYCDAPGPFETAEVSTYVAVSPTPSGWDAERVASFYREYNGIQLHGLSIHEGVPGHVLQLAHGRRLASATPVRRLGHSGVFVEGWAVYAEELMVDRGYSPSDDLRARHAIRLQQLKMQARTTINAILDVRVHADGMAEVEALELMQSRGFQEEGEAVGKWRRALLTAGQLPTYFAGYRAISGIAEDLRVLHGDWTDCQVHDLMLAYGSPAPRHLRTLLGI